MVELDNSLVLTLNENTTLWRRFVDGTIMFLKTDSIIYLLDQLNNFHERIQLTYKVKHNNKLSFLDAILIKNAHNIDTTVYRKPTNTYIYINWNLHAPTTWKRGTLRRYLVAFTLSAQVKGISMKK